MGYGNHSLRGPVLVAFFVFHMQQNAETPGTVQLGTLGIGKAVAHAPATGLGSIAKEPGIARTGGWIGCESNVLPWGEDRRVHRKRGNGIVDRSEGWRLCGRRNYQIGRAHV